jgi:DNA-binding transcriptional LysR family regulator
VLEGVSLDQLRTFIAAVDEGSFSAAARKLNRVQSAVSSWISDLEDQFGVVLFDRSGRFPKLTAEGVLLLADARSIVSGVATMKARARLMASGLETELSVVIDVFFPTSVLSATAKAFANRFPLTPLRLFVEGMGAGYQPVVEGRCGLGVLSTIPVAFPTLVSERLGEVPLVAVASPSHPLAQLTHRIPRHEMAKHLQLVLTDRSDLMSGRDFGVVAPSTWRLADLSTKYAFLKDGIGWGGMPFHMVENDIAAGSLVVLNADDVPPGGYLLTMSAYHRTSDPPGPAGRWLIDRLKDFWAHHLDVERAS